jgi:hypothetical protein
VRYDFLSKWNEIPFSNVLKIIRKLIFVDKCADHRLLKSLVLRIKSAFYLSSYLVVIINTTTYVPPLNDLHD